MQDPTEETQIDEQPEEQQSLEEDAAVEEGLAQPEEQETPTEEIADEMSDAEATADEPLVDEAPAAEEAAPAIGRPHGLTIGLDVLLWLGLIAAAAALPRSPQAKGPAPDEAAEPASRDSVSPP